MELFLGWKKLLMLCLNFKKKQYEIDHLYGGRKDRTPTAKERVEITLKYNRQIYLTDSCFIV